MRNTTYNDVSSNQKTSYETKYYDNDNSLGKTAIYSTEICLPTSQNTKGHRYVNSRDGKIVSTSSTRLRDEVSNLNNKMKKR